MIEYINVFLLCKSYKVLFVVSFILQNKSSNISLILNCVLFTEVLQYHYVDCGYNIILFTRADLPYLLFANSILAIIK